MWGIIGLIFLILVGLLVTKALRDRTLFPTYLETLDPVHYKDSQQIREEIKQKTGRSVSVGTNYAILNTLISKGQVESREKKRMPSDDPDAIPPHEYRLTERGSLVRDIHTLKKQRHSHA